MDGDDPEQTAAITWDAEHEHERTHARPCFLGGDDDCPEGECESVNRCINDPSKTCTSNADCVEAAFCVDDLCRYDWRGSLGDMARPVEPSNDPADDTGSRSCETAIDCVPAGVELCQPPIFRVTAKSSVTDSNEAVLVSAWDLNWDPDQRHDLLLEDADYFGSSGTSLAETFRTCISNYWKVNSTTGQWAGAYSSTSCPWVEEALP